MGETLEALTDFSMLLELWGIGRSVNRLREEQWEAASRIVVSVESVREAVKELRAAVDQQTREVQRLEARLDFQAYLLGTLLDVVSRPRETSARELRQLGEQRLRAELPDKALEAFLQSVAEWPDDFTCHYEIAAIQYEHLGDPDAAWASCEEALGFARTWRGSVNDPTPAYYSSRSALLAGRMLEDGGLIEEALSYYEAACKMSPDYGECFRRFASAAAKLGHVELAMRAVRAAVLIDDGEAMLVRHDEGLSGVRSEVDEVLASLRDETADASSRLALVAEEAVGAYQELGEAVRSPHLTEAWSRVGVDDLQAHALYFLKRLERLSALLERGTEQRRRASLLDVGGACRDLWEVTSRVTWAGATLKMVGPSLKLIRLRSGEEMDSTQVWAKAEHRRAKEEARELDAWAWVGVPLAMVFLFGLPPFVLVGGRAIFVGDFPLPYSLYMLASGSALCLPYLVFNTMYSRAKGKRKRARQSHAHEVVKATETVHSRRTAAVSEAERALQRVAGLEAAFHEAGRVLDRLDIRCSLIIVDSGSQQDDYDEERLAQVLQECARGLAPSPEPSLKELKEIIRKAPSMFLADLSIPDAERIANLLRHSYGVTVGIKRRYVGEFPPTGAALP